MKDSDNDVEKAIDNIFGSDFIEIDTNNSAEYQTNPHSNVNESLKNLDNTNKKSESDSEEVIFKDEDDEDNIIVNFLDVVNNFEKEKEIEIEEESKPEIVMAPEKEEKVDETIIKKDKKIKHHRIYKNNFFNDKKVIIYFIVGIVIGLLLIFFIFNYLIFKEKTVNCSYVIEDTGYKVSDEYKITYRKDKIKYIDGTYNYTVKTDEYKSQIEYIRKDKLPVIVNSNGMPGFTYIYEMSDDHFMVSSYLDFTLFDYKVIDKNNPDITPFSYFKLNSKTTYASLKNEFEKQGYKCVLSK